MNYQFKYLLFFFSLITVFCWSQNIAPTLSAVGNQAYCPKNQIPIVTDFNIIDPDDTAIEALFIQISTGYVQGEDILLLRGSHSNVQTSWSDSEGKLILFGVANTSVSYTDLIAATKDVVFESTSNTPSNKGFSITIGDANFLPSTGHYYEYVSNIGITWTAARTLADNRTYFGLKGYLATITSDEEAQLSGEQAAGAGWIGGSDVETEGVWKWMTGPEAGTVFWTGLSNGSTTNYANWNTDEPNQFGDEDYTHVTAPNVGSPGSWNDLSNVGQSSGDFQPKGYIVEYGGTPGDPVLNISTSSNIFVTAITSSTSDVICGPGYATLEATASFGEVLWFDSPSSKTPLFVGDTFNTNTISATKTYYALASVSGCTEGTRTPVTATVLQLPTIETVTDGSVCKPGNGTLQATASEGVINWFETISGGTSLHTGSTFVTPFLNETTTFYVDVTANGCTSSSRTPVVLSVQIPTSPIANSQQYFCDNEQATVSNLTATGTALLWYLNSSGGIPLDSNELLISGTYYVSQTANGCESYRALVNVKVTETVVLTDVTTALKLSNCDSSLDGDDTDGFSWFDLTSNESKLLNGKSPLDFSFNYFTDPLYAMPVLTPTEVFVNTLSGGQTIYVRMVNNSNNSCHTETSFDIQVNELPVIQNRITLRNCDEDGIADGFTEFNLLQATSSITNTVSDLTISYHKTVSDASLNTGALGFVFNNQIANTIYARVENNDGCYRIATINLEVSTTSFSPNYMEALAVCDDDDDDGFYTFDLTKVSSDFLSQFPEGQNLSVHYYENLNDAQLELNEISQPEDYTNTSPFSQTLFVRVESSDNNTCYGIGPHLLLTVHPLPDFEVDNSDIYCFDTNLIVLKTLNPQGNYTYEWRNNDGDIVSQSNVANVRLGGSYSVVATSSFGCPSLPVFFSVVESAVASIDADDITITELSDNNTIRVNNDTNNLGIGDYEFSLNDIDGPYQNEPFFENVPSGIHQLYVNDKNGCGTVFIDVFILGFPRFFTPNGDGYNDVWEIKGLGPDFIETSKISIFNRYGKLIKQINATNGSWNGTFNGQDIQNSDYWFVAELVKTTGDIKIVRGHFALIK